eukprot:c2531_g1_i1.p1 GENE.c2531_g1_i1~~c2531_g1_i1.p1  ORF type:complete len:292 (+),score=79.43 c2531_g1_i1:22-876(+)
MSTRGLRKQMSEQTVAICAQGKYSLPSCETEINISELMAKMMEGTTLYQPTHAFPKPKNLQSGGGVESQLECTRETTLAAAHRLLKEGAGRVVVLNFASAKNPGGGFKNGSQAQEESLARSSGLFTSISSMTEMYLANRRDPHRGLYSHYMIYSPNVPVFRDDSGSLIEAYPIDVITAPAVNKSVYGKAKDFDHKLMAETMLERMRRILDVALEHNHTHIVLGAYGCGVFAQDATDVSGWFDSLIGVDSPYRFAFQKIVFAVYDSKKKGGNFEAFENRFGEAKV